MLESLKHVTKTDRLQLLCPEAVSLPQVQLISLQTWVFLRMPLLLSNTPRAQVPSRGRASPHRLQLLIPHVINLIEHCLLHAPAAEAMDFISL